MIPLMISILSITLRTLNYGNYGTFLIIMGTAGFLSSNVVLQKTCFEDPNAEIPNVQAPISENHRDGPGRNQEPFKEPYSPKSRTLNPKP